MVGPLIVYLSMFQMAHSHGRPSHCLSVYVLDGPFPWWALSWFVCLCFRWPISIIDPLTVCLCFRWPIPMVRPLIVCLSMFQMARSRGRPPHCFLLCFRWPIPMTHCLFMFQMARFRGGSSSSSSSFHSPSQRTSSSSASSDTAGEYLKLNI